MKILSLPTDENGCTWYRLKQPLSKIGQLGLATTCFVGYKDFVAFEANSKIVVESSDVIIWRHGHEDLLEAIFEQVDCSKKLFVYDADDNDFESPWWQEVYRYYGTKDIWWVDKKTGKKIAVWIDKNSEEAKNHPSQILYDRKANIEKLEKLKKFVSLSDAVCVTTDVLAQVYKPYNQNILVIPNAIDFNIFRRVDIKRSDKKFRIGWWGGDSHYADIYLIHEAVKEFLKGHPDAVLVLAGSPPIELFKDILDRVEYYGWVHPDAHPYRLPLLMVDVAVIPLRGNKFDICKSPIKYLEASAVGIPSVVSRVTPYKEVIHDGFDGLMFSNKREFLRHLETLYKDRVLKAFIARNAYENTYQKFNLDYWAKEYFNKLKLLWEKKNGLTNDKK